MRVLFVTAVFLLIGIAIGFALKPQGKEFPPYLRVFLLWAASTLIGFLIPQTLPSLGVLFVAMLILAPAKPVERVGCFIAAFPALPEYYAADLPFPGLNYLTTLDHAKVAIVVFLIPVFLRAVSRPAPAHLRLVDHLVFAFFILSSVLSIRALPFTSMLRAVFDQFLIVLVPYIAISRTLTTAEDFRKILQYVYVGVLICCGVGLMCWLKQWNMYFSFVDAGSVRGAFITRDNVLRIEGPMINVMFGYLMAIGAILTAHFYGRKEQSPILALGRFGALLLVCYVAQSRGAILAGLVSAAVFYAMTRLSSGARGFVFAAGGAGAVFGAINVFANGFGNFDPYGTFNYRVELMRAGLKQLGDHPLFGTPNFVESGRFDHLLQGQGLIDIVNSYLQISLSIGLVGLSAYLFANGFVLASCISAAGRIPRKALASPADREAAAMNGLFAGMLLGMLALLSTTSLVSYVPHYSIIFLALAKGMATHLASAYPKHRIAPETYGDLYAPASEGRTADA